MEQGTTIVGRFFKFKRPTLLLSIEVDEFVMSSELFTPIQDLARIYKEEKERFVRLDADWKKFCELIFENPADIPNLENIVYPDDALEAQINFFTLPWEKTMKRWKELPENLKGSALKEERSRQSPADGV